MINTVQSTLQLFSQQFLTTNITLILQKGNWKLKKLNKTHIECDCWASDSDPTMLLPTMSHLLLPMLLLQSGYADQGRFWASWQGFATFPILLKPRPGENWNGRHEEPPGLALCSLTPRTWMWSRWDPDTHPRLMLSCSAILTLHLDISVYSFQNTVVLASWEPKYRDRNPFWRCSVSFWGRMKRESAILLMARKKGIKKLRSSYVFVH